jgi:2-keto-4-pentenoate hydratase/2-oxohepta-3-ene-1,7-dioic acid hydratase in catechol pathway
VKLVTFVKSGEKLSQVGVLVDSRVVPAANLLAELNEDPIWAASMVRFIQCPWEIQKNVGATAERAAGYGLKTANVHLMAPVPRPSKVIGLGYNYHALCKKENVKPSKEPELFAKMPTSVIGPFDPVVVPRSIDKVDFEAELGVIMGRRCSDVQASEALSFVAGYTVINDVTAKIIPRPAEAGSVMLYLKGVDNFAPTGPCLLTANNIDPQNLNIISRVNGQEKQHFNTSDMVHPVSQAIAYISKRITLEPGDLISTGTSLGIGIVQTPPVFLEDQDVVECEIDGIGTIRNTFNLTCKQG